MIFFSSGDLSWCFEDFDSVFADIDNGAILGFLLFVQIVKPKHQDQRFQIQIEDETSQMGDFNFKVVIGGDGESKAEVDFEEEESLCAEVAKYGSGKSQNIQKDPQFNPFPILSFQYRSQAYVNMTDAR